MRKLQRVCVKFVGGSCVLSFLADNLNDVIIQIGGTVDPSLHDLELRRNHIFRQMANLNKRGRHLASLLAPFPKPIEAFSQSRSVNAHR